jgi:hypothetical protein
VLWGGGDKLLADQPLGILRVGNIPRGEGKPTPCAPSSANQQKVPGGEGGLGLHPLPTPLFFSFFFGGIFGVLFSFSFLLCFVGLKLFFFLNSEDCYD